jgi:antitoxin component HigA of HigAB toxin-antitoxin module
MSRKEDLWKNIEKHAVTVRRGICNERGYKDLSVRHAYSGAANVVSVNREIAIDIIAKLKKEFNIVE